MQNIKDNNLYKDYKRKARKHKKEKEDTSYFDIQIIFVAIIIVTSLMLKVGNSNSFEYMKNTYEEMFENDTYMESTFSYHSFVDKMYNELQTRYGQLTTVFNELNGKGSSGEKPYNASTEKIFVEEKGISPVQGYISSPYGYRTDPFNKKKKDFHTGLDIANKKGTFIRSAFDGVVVKAGNDYEAGNFIKIQTGEEVLTLYAHNQFLFVKPGDKVLKGQVIATMGDTGYATGPHLHFEYRVNGIKYNPIYAIEI